jgi:hypothetical protein
MRLEELELRAPKVITLPELVPDRFRLRKRWSSTQGNSVEPRKIDKVITPFFTSVLVLSSSGWRKLVHTADLPGVVAISAWALDAVAGDVYKLPGDFLLPAQ